LESRLLELEIGLLRLETVLLRREIILWLKPVRNALLLLRGKVCNSILEPV
jgi:hypothetical protein